MKEYTAKGILKRIGWALSYPFKPKNLAIAGLCLTIVSSTGCSISCNKSNKLYDNLYSIAKQEYDISDEITKEREQLDLLYNIGEVSKSKYKDRVINLMRKQDIPEVEQAYKLYSQKAKNQNTNAIVSSTGLSLAIGAGIAYLLVDNDWHAEYKDTTFDKSSDLIDKRKQLKKKRETLEKEIEEIEKTMNNYIKIGDTQRASILQSQITKKTKYIEKLNKQIDQLQEHFYRYCEV